MPNPALAAAAIAAVTDHAFETTPGYCSRFVRQVCAAVYGDKYAALFGKSAIVTCDSFRAAHLVRPTAQVPDIETGDILFKRDNGGPFGHVGIYLGEHRVAENSSTHVGRIQGGKGYRTLAQFGAFDYVGRLTPPFMPTAPAVKPSRAVIKVGNLTHSTPLTLNPDGSAHIDRALLESLGVTVDWEAGETENVLTLTI